MSDTDSWLASPLDVVRDLLGKYGTDYVQHLTSFFSEKLKEGSDAWSQIPSLNDCKPHELLPNSLVRFRCMVQDMFGPEFYLDTYDSVTCDQGAGRQRCSGRYRDVVSSEAFASKHVEDISESDQESTSVTSERLVYYCIPVPGENSWVKEILRRGINNEMPSTSFVSVRNKRSADEEGEYPAGDSEVMDTCDSTYMKKQRVSTTSEDKPSQPTKVFSGDFPLPGETGQPCLVKVYDESTSLKLNDVIEVVGVLSVDPALTAIIAAEASESPFVDEYHARNPPASLVPRLHVVHLNKPATLYPRLAPVGGAAELHECREELLAILERALLGDRLAAEYTLCGLAASISFRREHLAIGKFCLSLSGCPSGDDCGFITCFYKLLQQLRPASHMLDLTVSNLNGQCFIPKKNYTTDRLVSGILQLAAGTLLVIDETRLEPGQLDENGTQNLAALGSLISWQRVAYDFSYHTQEFDCDVSVIALSDGKSILPHDCQVPLLCQSSPASSMLVSYEAVRTYLTPKLLERLRSYLGTLLLMSYEVPEAMQKHVQDDFVSARQHDAKAMTVEDFQLRITLARLVSITSGLAHLTVNVWNKVRLMEEERKSRFVVLPSNGHHGAC